jgi:hypothetical protein
MSEIVFGTINAKTLTCVFFHIPIASLMLKFGSISFVSRTQAAKHLWECGESEPSGFGLFI